MSKVYIVTEGQYDDYCIRAVFSDRENAEKFCAMCHDDWGKNNTKDINYYDEVRVEEYDMDGLVIDCQDYILHYGISAYIYDPDFNNPYNDYILFKSVYPIQRRVTHTEKIGRSCFTDCIEITIPISKDIYDRLNDDFIAIRDYILTNIKSVQKTSFEIELTEVEQK